MDPLNIMNEDCWRELIERLEPQEKQSMRHTCQLFSHILETRTKNEWKFELALPFVFDKLFEHVKYTPTYTMAGRRRRRVYRRHQGSVQGLLNSRLICKAWAKSVNEKFVDFLQDLDSRFPMCGSYEFKGPGVQNIEKLLAEYPANFPGNPFFGNYIEITTPSALVDPRNGGALVEANYRSKLMELMDRFGKNISRAKIVADGFQDLRTNFCTNLVTILRKVPKLRTLEILGLNEEEEFRVEDDISNKEAKIINEIGLPDLPNLKNLSFWGKTGMLPQLLFDKYHGNLQTLIWKSATFLHYPEREMNCLSKLTLINLNDIEGILQFLKSLKAPKLQNLNITEYSGRRRAGETVKEEKSWNVDRILQNVQHLPLQELTLRLYFDYLTELQVCEGSPSFSNQTLKRLTIYCKNESKLSFNYLLHLNGLETLCVNHYDESVEGLGEIISPENSQERFDILKFLKADMHESNVWKLLPSLQEFQFTQRKITGQSVVKTKFYRSHAIINEQN